MTASIRKLYPCSGPYPLNVSLTAISSTALCIASITAFGKGRVTSPIPKEITLSFGWVTLKVFIFLAISENK